MTFIQKGPHDNMCLSSVPDENLVCIHDKHYYFCSLPYQLEGGEEIRR